MGISVGVFQRHTVIKQLIKRTSIGISALIVGVLSPLVLVTPQLVSAAGNTCTWTGGGGDNKFSTVGNWSGCGGGVPTSGDALVFDSFVGALDTGSSNARSLKNDITADFTSITVNHNDDGGNHENDRVYLIDKVSIEDGGTLVGSGANSLLSIQIGKVSSTGDITINDVAAIDITADKLTLGGDSWMDAGVVNNAIVASGSTLGTNASTAYGLSKYKKITVQSGAAFTICTGGSDQSKTTRAIPTNIELGGGSGVNPIVSASPCMGASGAAPIKTPAIDFTGNFILNSDATFEATGDSVSFSGGLTTNGHQLTVKVGSGATILGSGSTGTVTVDANGMIAPGHSPGLLTVTGLTVGGIYDVEIGGTSPGTGYDQVKVNGSVDVSGGSLSVSLYDKYLPKKGETYTIIDNDGNDAVVGTFKDLAEGTTFKVGDGGVFKITYKGGDGNDVVLSVVTAPKSPDTGFGIITENPWIAGVVAAVAAGAIIFIARRYRANQ